MEFLIPLVPFVVAGLVVIFIAFWGGPSAAREAYLTRGRRGVHDHHARALRRPRHRGPRRGDRGPRRVRGRHRQPPLRGGVRDAGGRQAALHPDLQELPHARRGRRPRRDRPEPGRARRASTSSASSTRSRSAGPATAGCRRSSSPARMPMPLPPTWRRPPASLRPEPRLQPSLHFARKHRAFPSGPSALVLAWPRPSKPKLRGENGAWGNQMAGRPGANRREA